MYQLYYDYIKNKYGNNSKQLFRDSDSAIYEIKAEDVYEDLSRDEEIFHLIIVQPTQNITMIQTNWSLAK